MGRTAGILSIQLKPVLTDKAANIEKVKNLIEQFCDKTLDLVVIPEFFSTGVDHKSMTGEPEDTNGGVTQLSCSIAAEKSLPSIAKFIYTDFLAAQKIHILRRVRPKSLLNLTLHVLV